MTLIGQVAVPLSHALKAQGFLFEPETVLQLLTAATVSRSVGSYEEARQLKVPLIFDKPPAPGVYRRTAPPLDRRALLDRTEAILRKREGHGARPSEGDAARAVEALKIAATVVEHIQGAGLCVNLQKLMFSAQYPVAVADRLLAGMYDETLLTSSVCVAVAAGKLAPLPSRLLATHLAWLGAKHMYIMGSRPIETMSAWVGKRRPYVVEFPAPDVEAGETARLDHFNATGHGKPAEVGLGFFLAAPEPEGGYTVLTPWLSSRQDPATAGASSWFNEFHAKWYRPGSKGSAQIDALLHVRKRHAIVQLDACPTCARIHVADADKRLRPDLARQCGCAA